MFGHEPRAHRARGYTVLMHTLTTVAEIEQALNTLAPDQTGVIREMASIRGINPDTMTLQDWKNLILEEAVASWEPTEPDKSGVYYVNLRQIADGIPGQTTI